jgi:autotransporter-associated beta strand protein
MSLSRFVLGKTVFSRLLTLLAIAVAAAAPSPAVLQAAIFSWTGPGGSSQSPTSGNWNAGGNWVGGLPPTNDPATVLDFGGSTGTYTSTHNLGLVQASGLTFNSSAPVAPTVNANAGSSLRMVTDVFVDPTISQNSTGSFVFNVPMEFVNNVTFNAVAGFEAPGAVTLGGNLTGTGNLTHTGRSLLILGGDNSGYSGNIIVLPPSGDNTGRAVAVLSARSPGALGTGNLHLLGAVVQGLMPADATAVLEIGADLDGAGNSTDFSRAVGMGAGQINLAGPDERGAFGFAARGAVRVVNLGGNAVPTTLVNKQPFLPYGDGDGYSFGSATADNTLVFMNPIDFLDNANRNIRTIRGTGNVPEGRLMGSVLNSANANTHNISGTGGVILDNVSANSWQQGATYNPVIVSGGVYLAVSDPASGAANSPLGRNNTAITIGNTTGGAGGFGTPLGDINTGVMTYGPGTSGASPTPIITVARNFVIGAGGTGIMTVGGFTADHTRFSGEIDLNNVATRFTARTGGRVEFSGVVSDTGGLTVGNTIIEGNATIPGINVEGRGTVVLSGSNTYGGNTEVTHGTLLVNNTAGSGTGTGAVNVQSGATLGGSGTIIATDAFATVTINSGGILAPHTTPTGTSALTIGGGGLTLNAGALLNFNIGAPGVSDVLHLTGVGNSLNLAGNATLNLTNVGGLTVANYPIITHTGGSVSGGGAINIGANPGLGFNYAIVNTPGQVELRVTSSAPSKTWTGAASNVWSTTAANWAPSNFANGDQVVFNNTGSPANSNVNIAGAVSPAFITVDNGGAVPTYTLGGDAITGTTGINKTGTGTLVLSGANTFSGVTSIGGGTLRVTNTSGSATGTGLVAIAPGSTVSGSGTISPTGPNTVIIGGAGARIVPHLTPTTANTLTIGSNGLTLRNGSILDFNFGAPGNHDRVVLTGANNTLTLDGTTTLNVNAITGFGTGTFPVFEFGNRTGLGNVVLGTLPPGDLVFNLLNNPTNIALAVSGTVTWSGATNSTWDTTTQNWSLGGGPAAFSNNDAVRFTDAGANRNINVAAPVTVAGITASNSSGNDYTIGGASIGGPGGVTKSGTGVFTLNNSNTFTGKTTVTGGTLSIASVASLGAEPAAPTPDAITIAGATLRATGPAEFSVNRGVTLGAGGGTINVADAGEVLAIPATFLGAQPLTVTGNGTLQLASSNNMFTSVTINDATVELKPPASENVVVNANATTGILGDNNVPIVIDGGTLKFTTTASSQNITIDRVIQFGPDGGTIDLRNTRGGTLGGAAGGAVGGGGVGNMRVDLTSTVGPVVVKWNGGESGLSTNTPANGDWNEGANNLEWQAVTTGAQAPPLRIELSHAGMTTIRAAQFGTYNGPFTIRGGVGGDVTAAGNQVTEIGRVQVSGGGAENLFTFSGGMFLEGALQFNLSTTFRVFDNDITLRGTASGFPANVTFNGRATGTAFASNQQAFQLTLGTPDVRNSRTLTIERGATANFDVRIRTDQPNSNGVEVPARMDIKAGGMARARQSWLGLAVGASDRPVGYIEIYGDIVGNGTVTDGESVFEVQMPFNDRNMPRTSEGGITFRGGSAAQHEARLIVNGDNSGSGAGLLIRGAPRDTRLYTVNNQQTGFAPAFPTDPVTSVAKLSGNPDGIASSARLAALTGSGGYLTLAAVNETFPFPAGGEWPAGVPVGLKVINSNANGDDVSISGSFQHNINVDAGATLGASGATLGPAAAAANLGLIKGLGTISGATFHTGATVAPGFGMGALATSGTATLNGTLQVEINGTQHDQLNSLGNLVLGASSTLNLPAGNVYDGSKTYIIAAYTGTRTGNFGSTSPLPAGYTLDYGTGTNSFVTLRPANPLNEWFRAAGSTWHTAGNWLTGAVPNSNADTARLWTAMLSDGTVDLAATGATVRSLSIRNSAASYTVAGSGGGRLTLESNSGNASIVVEPGNLRNHTISAGLTLGSNTDINIAGGTLTLAGQQNWGGRAVNVGSGQLRYAPTAAASGTAGASLSIGSAATVELAGTASATSDGTGHVNITNNGSLAVPAINYAVGGIDGNGTTMVGSQADVVVLPPALTANHVRQSSLVIGNGSAVNTRAGGGTSVLGSLSIFGTPAAPLAEFDLNNNAAILNYTGASPIDTVRQQILASRGSAGLGATWGGLGISSSAAAAAAATDPESRSIGFAENATMPLGPYATFRGQPVDDTSILMAFTRTGDANLDGVVNDDDVTIVGATYAPGLPQASWALGDFDFNGFVDDDDVTLLGVFYDPSAPPLAAPGASVVAVPEPGTVTLLLTGLLGCLLALVRKKSR